MYDYKNAKKRIYDTITSRTPVQDYDVIPKRDEDFSFKNGIRSWVGAVFIDIVDSSSLFKSGDEKVARVIRSFSKEVINILSDFDRYRQIGIRGDCIYGIYTTPNTRDLVELFNLAETINTFIIMFNYILEKQGFTKISIGVGLGCSKDLIIKVGKERSGINDMVWIGNAVVDAANLSSIASRNNINSIAMNETFYTNIINTLRDSNQNYEHWIKKSIQYSLLSNDAYYHCNTANSSYYDWIKEQF